MVYVFLLNRPWVGPQERLPPGMMNQQQLCIEEGRGGTRPHMAVKQGSTGGPPSAERRPKAVPQTPRTGGDAVNASLS
jgi:hypothetical protein